MAINKSISEKVAEQVLAIIDLINKYFYQEVQYFES